MTCTKCGRIIASNAIECPYCKTPVGDFGSALFGGLLALGGLALGDFLSLQSARAASPAKDASVILFWLSGGPGHMETWDPKPDAVEQFRGPFGTIRTSGPAANIYVNLQNRESGGTVVSVAARIMATMT